MNLEKWVAVLLLVFFGGYLFLTGNIYLDFWEIDDRFNARTIPYLVGSVGFLGSSVLLINLTWSPGPAAYHFSSPLDKQAVWLITGVALYISLLEAVGFIPSSVLFLFFSAYLLGERRIGLLLITAMLVPLSLWAILTFLGIYLHPGDWAVYIQGPGQ